MDTPSNTLETAPEDQPKHEMILTITNGHYPCCGTPPRLEMRPGRYTSYFENSYGEQCILQYDPEEKFCRLWMGDVGWEEPLKVVEFRGRPVVVFARTREERDMEFKMNKQFDHSELYKSGLLKESPPEEKELFKQEMYKFLRKMFGKPRLTDEECEFLSHCPVLNRDEMAVIVALWNMWNR